MDNLIGKRLDGRYSIESLVGVGGMANVYRGTDLKTGNQIAVKVLKDEFLDNEELVRRFKNESKAISILSHPNIVKVYDVSVTDKLQYIVMEYVDGITLKEYLKQRGGALTWKETVHFATQILSALQHAHSKGIIHRDVKPQNIMLLADGSIKMMDFGIARFSRAQSQTVSDKAIGSVHYISPSRPRVSAPTPAPTSTLSASCCTRCCRAACRLTATVQCPSPSCRFRRSQSRWPKSHPRPRQDCARLPRKLWKRTPTSATRAPRRCWPLLRNSSATRPSSLRMSTAVPRTTRKGTSTAW